MAAKLVVTSTKGGSRISLIGASGTELLTSKVFNEPRAKGATLRALKGLLGEVTVDDQTVSTVRKPVAAAKADKVTRGAEAVAKVNAKPARRRRAASAKR